MTETPRHTVRVAQIGCGYWGPNLLRNLDKSPLAEVVTVVELDAGRREYVEISYPGIQTSTDIQKVLADQSIAAVVVATPAGTHEQLVNMCLDNNKHVLVEKPLCFSIDRGELLVKKAAERSRVLAIGHVYLYHPYIELLQRLVKDGDFGDLVYLNLSRLNLGVVRSDVNAWWNLAPHDVSQILAVRSGMLPETISATGIAHLQPGVEDVVFATLRWADGVSAHIHVSWLEPEKIRRMTLVGSKKMAVFDDTASSPLTIYDKGVDVVPSAGMRMDYDNFDGPALVLRQGSVETPKLPKSEPLALEIEDFLRAVIEGRSPVADANNALDVTKVLSCGQKSLELGGELIHIP